MGKSRRIKVMENNIVNAKEVFFSIAEILGESTKEPAKAEEVQEKVEDACSIIYYPPP